MGRLDQFNLNGELEAEYRYNGFGERIQKQQKKGTKTYQYNGNGQLLAEQQNQKKRTISSQDTVWLNGQPIAQIRTEYKGKGKTKNTEILYLHNDHLGTPRQATNQDQKIIWRWDSDAFGSKTADSNPDKDKSEIEINLRFPGQYYDQESGLHYNYFRYYDPQIGRYITSDPIGLAGGVNTYGYVGGNPLSRIDPFGLTQQQIARMLLLAQQTQSDLEVPDQVSASYLFYCRGCGITNPLTKNITISGYYLNDLDCNGLKSLLRVIIHESIHRTRPRSDMILRPFYHPDIYNEAARRSFKKRVMNKLKESCECQN